MMPGPACVAGCTFMSGLELLGSGREADVYRLDGERVLRRYRDGYDVAQEAEIMAYVGAFGYPVPTVYDVDGPDLVMELLDGPTMAAALEAADLELPAGATMLADLHDRLHALPARSPDRDGDRVIHLDLHPENVLLVARGPVVIDWRNATDGPPDFDLALSAMVLAEVSFAVDVERAVAVRALLAGFLEHVGGDPLRLLDRALARRLANPTLSAAEHDLLGSAAALVRELA